jgi:hypothetical protein
VRGEIGEMAKLLVSEAVMTNVVRELHTPVGVNRANRRNGGSQCSGVVVDRRICHRDVAMPLIEGPSHLSGNAFWAVESKALISIPRAIAACVDTSTRYLHHDTVHGRFHEALQVRRRNIIESLNRARIAPPLRRSVRPEPDTRDFVEVAKPLAQKRLKGDFSFANHGNVYRGIALQ